jgi:hypothetical protein
LKEFSLELGKLRLLAGETGWQNAPLVVVVLVDR